ncbi:MAG: LysR family transcriptional regulator [Chloroflexi bacterium]|nr:LysR family transcriptional regulator [Chloroflexota bacterium]
MFLIAAEEENFSVAARKLHLSQPAVSFQIQSLEEHLKVQLFQRTGKRIVLTEAGRDLMPLAREMISLAARIEETMCMQQGIVKGQIQIACSTSPGKYILPHLIGAFRKKYPDVQVSVQVMSRESVEEKLLTKQMHVGLMSLPSKHKELDCVPIFDDELILIVGSTHAWANREAILPQELNDSDWILREGGAATRQLVTTTLAEHSIAANEMNVAMELGSVEAVEQAVEAGHGAAFVSRVAVKRGLEIGRIKTIPVDGLTMRRQILLARNRTRTNTCAQVRFQEFIQSDEGQQVISNIIK